MTLLQSRRRFAAFASMAACLTLALTACGGGEEDSAGGEASSTGGFPVTIETARGEITVDRKPERIVALTPRHVALLDLLDENPVGFASSSFDNAQMLAMYPWLEGMYEGEPDPGLMTAESQPSPEAVAELNPDLILTNIWAVDDGTYDQLSAVAPTYVGTDPNTQSPWQDDLGALARLTGNDPAVVDQAQTGLDDELAEAAARLPGLQGTTFQVAALADGEQLQLSDYGNEPLLGLGLEPGDGQPTSGAESVTAPLYSMETIDQLTADVLFIATEHRDPSGEFRAKLEADPRLAELPAAKNGTLVFLDASQWVAINGGYPASYSWWLDGIVPVLEKSQLNQSQ